MPSNEFPGEIPDERPVMIAAGGTGGHIFPGLAVAERLAESAARVVWLGGAGGMEASLVPAAGVEFEALRVEGLRGRRGFARAAGLWRFAAALPRAVAALRRRRPGVVLGMGGFVSGPAGLAAGALRVPLVIHEQNAVAGLTNRCLAPLSRRVLLGFPDTLRGPKTAVVGNPVRRALLDLPPRAPRPAARRLRLLVVGGSRGAQVFNQTVPAALAALPPALRPQTLQQTGRGRQSEARAAAAAAGIDVLDAAQVFHAGADAQVFHAGADAQIFNAGAVAPDAGGVALCEFIDDMPAALGWADVVLCRAGAMTLAELAAAGAASLLVPYPHAADDHQTRNARFFAQGGGAEVLPQDALAPAALAARLAEFARAPARLDAMGRAARALARPRAARAIADICLACRKS